MTWVQWQFSPLLEPSERFTYLLEEIAFPDIVDSIVTDSRERVTLEKIDRPDSRVLKGSCRVVFTLEVQPRTLDLFYNSPWGYRGQYCVSADNGLRCNRLLLDALMDSLIACLRANARVSAGDVDLACQSLQLPSAKIWIRENGQIDPKDYTLTEQVLHPPWLACAREARADLDANRNPTPAEKLNAIVGVRAAYGSVLDVKGGWITPNGTELIDDYKRHRAEHIRDYGFS
jgi:hypothetical protein